MKENILPLSKKAEDKLGIPPPLFLLTQKLLRSNFKIPNQT